jgi:hypothetical protein
MTGFSDADRFWLDTLPADMARFKEMFAGFIGVATRLFKEFERIVEARWSQFSCFLQELARIQSVPPVAGYEDFLIGQGHEPIEARLLGRGLNKLAATFIREREAERSLAGVFRAIMKVKAKVPLAAARRVQALRAELALPYGQLAVEGSCREVGRPELINELPPIIEQVINREPAARGILIDKVKMLLPGLPDPRGRRFNIKTAKHLLLLHLLENAKRSRAYTWNDCENRCIDPAAEATRVAVGDPSFDPRYAYRALRKRRRR